MRLILIALALNHFAANAHALVIGPGDSYQQSSSTFVQRTDLTMTGGEIRARDDNQRTWFLGGPFDISAGRVNGRLTLDNFSQGTISGGVFDGLMIDRLDMGGSLQISGGSFGTRLDVWRYRGSVTISGGEFGSIRLFASATGGAMPALTIIGTNWQYNGTPLSFSSGTLDRSGMGGTYSGLLQDGNPISFSIGGLNTPTTFTLVNATAVPVVGTLPLLASGLGLLALIGRTRGAAADRKA